MRKILRKLYSGPFQLVLVISFSLVAALTIGVGAWTISTAIRGYLSDVMNERIARDMRLAQADYELLLREIEGSALRLSRDPHLSDHLNNSIQGDQSAAASIGGQLSANFDGLAFGGNRLISVIDRDGNPAGAACF